MTDSIIGQHKTRSKRKKSSVVNSRNVRAKSEEEKVKRPGSAWIWFYKHEREKMKSANIDGGNDLNTIGEKDLMEHIKEKYHSLSDSEKLPFIKINNDKKAMYKEYKEKLPQGVPKDTICTRMSVIGAYDVISKLTEEQKDSVRLIGLDGILELRPFKICRELCLYLVNEFDCDSCMLNINGRKISVGPSDISHVLGLKDHGVRVSTCVPSDDIAVDSNYLKLNKLKADLVNMEDADEQFKRKFALYMFGIFFCPAVKPEVDKGFLSIVKDINKLAEINLAHLVFDCLVQGIRERQQTKNMYVRGCLAFLMIFFLGHIGSESLSLQKGLIPRLSLWDKDAVKLRVDVVKASNWYKQKKGPTCSINTCLHKTSIPSGVGNEQDGKNQESERENDFHQKVSQSNIGSQLLPVSKAVLEQHCSINARLGEIEKLILDVKKEIDGVRMDVKNELEAFASKVDTSLSDILQELQKRSNIPYECKKCNSKDSTHLKMKKDLFPPYNEKNDVACNYVSSASNSVEEINCGSGVQRVNVRVKRKLKSKASSTTLSATLAHNIKLRNQRVKKPGPYKKSPWVIDKSRHKSSNKMTNLGNGTKKQHDGVANVDKRSLPKRKKIVCKWTNDETVHKLLEFLWDKNSLDLGEMIVDLGLEQAYRSSMISLSGTEWVSSEIINLVAIIEKRKITQMDLYGDTRVWFLPTHYSYFILDNPSRVGTEYFEERTWGGDDIASCDMIFVPMNDRMVHWYAFAINLAEPKVVIFDSLWTRRNTYNEERLADVKKVVHWTQNILKNKKGYSYDLNHFPIEAATWIPRQVGNYDCGIYVINFMRKILSIVVGVNGGEKIQFDSVDERQKIAIELFMDNGNKIRDSIMEKLFMDSGNKIRDSIMEKLSLL